MNKKTCVVANLILLAWFSLDMIGVPMGERYLVTRSYKEDGVFYLCYLIALLFFFFREQVGRYILSAWLFLWLVAQLFSHEWLTLFGGGEGMIRHFQDAIHWVESSTRYIPDVYHTILHLLLMAAYIVTLRYTFLRRRKNKVAV